MAVICTFYVGKSTLFFHFKKFSFFTVLFIFVNSYINLVYYYVGFRFPVVFIIN